MMTKAEAIQFYRDACASDNTYKAQGGYGPGGYSQFQIFLFSQSTSSAGICNLITCGWYDQPEYNHPISEKDIKSLHCGEEHFDLTAQEAEELRSAWVEKTQTKPSVEYARTQF